MNTLLTHFRTRVKHVSTFEHNCNTLYLNKASISFLFARVMRIIRECRSHPVCANTPSLMILIKILFLLIFTPWQIFLTCVAANSHTWPASRILLTRFHYVINTSNIVLWFDCKGITIYSNMIYNVLVSYPFIFPWWRHDMKRLPPRMKAHTKPNNHDDVIKWKQFPRYWPFVRGIHRSPVNSPHKGQWRGALMFSLICVWINGWVNNGEAVDLRRYRAHYNVTLMMQCLFSVLLVFAIVLHIG